MKKKKITKELIKKEVLSLLKDDEDSDSVLAGTILLAGNVLGPNKRKIFRFLKIKDDIKSANKIYARIKENRIFTHFGVDSSDWFKKGSGGVSFILDVLSATGKMKRVYNDEK